MRPAAPAATLGKGSPDELLVGRQCDRIGAFGQRAGVVYWVFWLVSPEMAGVSDGLAAPAWLATIRLARGQTDGTAAHLREVVPAHPYFVIPGQQQHRPCLPAHGSPHGLVLPPSTNGAPGCPDRQVKLYY